MFARFKRWYRRHWFAGVFASIALIWAITLVSYALGFKGVTFRNRFTGGAARIDFNRQYDRVVLELAEDVGLELDPHGEQLSGAVVRLKAGLPGLCWVCGGRRAHGGIGLVDYRQGDWLFRAPSDLSKNSEVLHGRPESRAFISTIAFNRSTGERVQVEAGASLAAQTALLGAHGLVVAEPARLTLGSLGDLPDASMQREGCIIFNLAFVAASLLWLVLGGSAWLLVRVVRARRSHVPRAHDRDAK